MTGDTAGTDGRTNAPSGGANGADARFCIATNVKNCRLSPASAATIRLGKRVPRITGGRVDRSHGSGTPGAHGRTRQRKPEHLAAGIIDLPAIALRSCARF